MQERRIKNDYYQNAVVAFSYEDYEGNIFFLVGQPQKQVKNSNLGLWPFGFSGGQVDQNDAVVAVVKGYKNPSDFSFFRNKAITSINRYGGARELMEETGIDISTISRFTDVPMEKFNTVKNPQNMNETSFYSFHMGIIGPKTASVLHAIVASHMSRETGRRDDLKNAQFINASCLHSDTTLNREKSRYIGTPFENKVVLIETKADCFSEFYIDNVLDMMAISEKKRMTGDLVKNAELVDELQAYVLIRCDEAFGKENHHNSMGLGLSAEEKVSPVIQCIKLLNDTLDTVQFTEKDKKAFKSGRLKAIYEKYEEVFENLFAEYPAKEDSAGNCIIS